MSPEETFIDVPEPKKLSDNGLDAFGQAPLVFTGVEVNKQAKTVGEIGLPSNFLVDGGEGWVLKGQKQIALNPGQDIQSALDAVLKEGGGTVALNPGTYHPRRNLYIKSGVTLAGAGNATTVIDFEDGAYSVIIEGDDPYSTGTVALTQDSTTVTGTGTAWTVDMIGQSMLLAGDWYPIENVVSPTSITLGYGFSGTTQSGLTYVLATINTFANVKNLTIQNSSVSLLKVQYTYETHIDDLVIGSGNIGIDVQDTVFFLLNNLDLADCVTGIYLNNTWGYILQSFFVYNCTGVGIQSDGGGDATGGIDFGITNNGGVGIKFTNTSKVAFFSFTIDSNGSHGIELVAGCDDCTFTGGSVNDNAGDGLKLTATDDKNSFAQMQFLDNGAYGVEIAASTCDNNIILGNVFDGNSSGQLTDSGTGTLIRSNIGVTDAP